MKVTKPAYYDRFRCIAGDCPDSCCKEWDIQIDEQSAAYYRAIPGSLGDRLRQVLTEENGGTVMTIVDGRCPMWREDGLCRIQAELGEDALCHVCSSFPRLRHDYGSLVELGLELSCPEAARLILNAPAEPLLSQENGEERDDGCDEEALESLLDSRETALSLLENSDPKEALTLLLLYGYQAQDELDGAEKTGFDRAAALETAASFGKESDPEDFFRYFRELEILTSRWSELLRGTHSLCLPPQTIALARYLIGRYWLQAAADYDLVCRVKFIAVCCILVGALGGNYEQTAQLFSKEIENDADNVDAILEAVYTCPAFTDEKLLGLLK